MFNGITKLVDLALDTIIDKVSSSFKNEDEEKKKELKKLILDNKDVLKNELSNLSIKLHENIGNHEGTSKDLKSIPVLGSIVLFLRGAQRPVWGFLTIYLDLRWFFGGLTFTEQQQTALIVINVLVLGFLFGERALLNLEPLLTRLINKQKK